MRVWTALVFLVIGLAVGAAVAFALEDPAPLDETEAQDSGAVPQPCLDAIAAARDRLLLNPEVLQTLRDYQALAGVIAEDVSNLQVPDLRESLGRFNDLNARTDRLIERFVGARFTLAADRCEEIAGVSTSASVTPSPQ